MQTELNEEAALQTATHSDLDEVFNVLIERHKLPDSYRVTAENWFIPILEKIASRQSAQQSPLVVGINGCQGSGKSTLAALAVEYFTKLAGKSAAALSIDDFYLTIAERKQMAESVHSLLLTRGVPGTHDLQLASSTLDSLINTQSAVSIPRFNKAIDDREPESNWDTVNAPLDIIILEGWCVGSTAQTEEELLTPVNELEEFEDRSGSWRRYVNAKLATDYADFFARIDTWIMLKAPSFASVYHWRLEQEEKLKASVKRQRLAKTDQIMSPQQIRRFIQYYQRVTEHNFATLPQMADVVFDLDNARDIIKMYERV